MDLLLFIIAAVFIILGATLVKRITNNIKGLKEELKVARGEKDHWHRRYLNASRELSEEVLFRRNKEKTITNLEDNLVTINNKLKDVKKEYQEYVTTNTEVVDDLKSKLEASDKVISSNNVNKKIQDKVIKSMEATITKLTKALNESEQKHIDYVKSNNDITEALEDQITRLKKQLESSVKPVKPRATTKRK